MLYKTTTHITVESVLDAPSHEDASRQAMLQAAALRPAGMLRVARVDTNILSVAELATSDRLVSWQRGQAAALGDDDQRARWQAGLLPDEELFAIARDELFRPFAAFQRRKRMIASDIAHPRAESGMACAPSGEGLPVEWSSSNLAGVSAAEWPAVIALEAARSVACAHRWLAMTPAPRVIVSLRTHVGTCQRCNRSAHQNSALVEIPFAGRKLSREYTLEIAQ